MQRSVNGGYISIKRHVRIGRTFGRGILLSLLLLFIHICIAGSAFAVSQPDIDKEVAAGRKVANEVEKQFELLSDPAAVVRLESILQKLTQNLEPNYPWQVKIIRKDDLNAFCLPGGFIYFFTGMLERFSSDAEIAAVMAHEISHIVERHGVKQSARNAKLSLGAILVMVATGGAAAPAIMAQVAQVAIMNSYSIDYEQEADIEGLKMLINAGYPPSAIVTTMEKFMAEELKQPIYNYGIYMSHPESRKRVEYLAKYLRDRRIPLNRKLALLTLRPSVVERGNRYVLLVDDVEVWGGPMNNEVKKTLDAAAQVIESSLQMELVPYDLAVQGDSLRLKNDIIASNPIPKGMPPLGTLRNNLIERVNAARRNHPIAKYFG